MYPLEFILNRLAYPSGALIAFNPTKPYLLITFTSLFLAVFYAITEGAYYVVYISDLNKSTACLGTLAFTITSLVRVILLLHKNEQLKNLIVQIRSIIEKNSSVKYLSTKAEKRSKRYAIMFFAIVYLTLLFMMIAPLVNMLLEYTTTGMVVETRWDLPFRIL